MENGKNVEIGLRIHNARKAKKLSMKELGKKVKLHESTISRYEKGEIMSLDIEKMKDFAKALDTTPAYLMGWEDESYKDFGKAIHNIRIKKSISIMEMADELHISVETLKEYEDGKRHIPADVLNKIASYLEVDVNEITGIHIKSEDDRLERIMFSKNKHTIEGFKRWNDVVGVIDFTDEELDKLMEYAKFLLSQRKEN